MENSNFNLLQLVPPAAVMVLLVSACFFFYTRYVKVSKALCLTLQKISTTIRSMSDGDEMIRKTGVGRVFQNTQLEPIWRDFSKTLHTQTGLINGITKNKNHA